MKIAVFGTGSVGQALATRLADLGHEVAMGTRNVAATLEKGTLGEFLKTTPSVYLANYSEAAANAAFIVNATKGNGSIEAFGGAGASIGSQIVIDLSNPLDFSTGGLPIMIEGLSNNNSLGEELQRAFPTLKIVKTLNTMWSGLMVNPTIIGGGDHINYICGNDADAKAKVKDLLKTFGWSDDNILDLGDITGARSVEGILPLWVRIWSVTQNGAFNFKIVK